VEPKIGTIYLDLEHYMLTLFSVLCFKASKTQGITLKGTDSKIFSKNGYGTIPALQYHPPSPCSISWYKYDHRTSKYMSIELQIPAADLHLQDEEKSDEVLKNIEQEIECPRCNDIMTLTSDFDKLGYVCQECDLLLVMK
jgi:hypothetical protein